MLKVYNAQRLICIEQKIGRILSVGWLVGWILWHINLRRLYNTESIIMRIVSPIF